MISLRLGFLLLTAAVALESQNSWDGYNRIAGNYEKERPEYPEPAISFWTQALGLQSGKKVLDLGSGTGKLTRALEPFGLSLIAVEPVPELRMVFSEQFPLVPVLGGQAEKIPLESETLDAVVVGTAFHWFEGETSLKEIARVLKPGKSLGLIWNVFDGEVEWVKQIRALLEDEENRATHDDLKWQEVFQKTSLFTPLQAKTIRYSYPGTVQDVIDRVYSAKVMGKFSALQKAKVIKKTLEILDSYPETKGKEIFEIPYRIEIYWCHLMENQNQKSWPEIFKSYPDLVGTEAGRKIVRQYELHSSQPFTTSNPQIKAIPIQECGEELVDVQNGANLRIQMMPAPKKPFESPNCNSGLPSASKIRKRVFIQLGRMVEALDSLAPFFGYEPGQIHIKVFEGLRDLPTQKLLFDNKLEEIRRASPSLSFDEAWKETCKWVSPVENNIPVHSTGAAIDIRLWDTKKNNFLDLDAFGVIWGANPNAPTFSEEISKKQKLNRFYCLLAAATAGLTNYSYEFWHFSSGDRYDAWIREQPYAEYSSVKSLD